MRGKIRNSIASYLKLPQFTTMNVIDGQAGLVIYSSLIFYSLTINNILNIIVLLILAGVAINLAIGERGIFNQSKLAVEKYKDAQNKEEEQLQLATNAMMGDVVVREGGTVTLTDEEYEIFKNQTTLSTDEKKIGTWIDGKPLYRQIITVASATIPANTEYKVVDTSSILDKSNIRVVSLYGGYYTEYGQEHSQFHAWVGETNGYGYKAYYRQGADAIRVYGSWGNINYTITNLVFNIEYTKTTD